MSKLYLRWILSACWIAVAALVFLAVGASSGRSWLYLVAIALGPPVALVRLWPEDAPQTAAEMMHDRGDRS
jgi:hypothetical protein